LREFGNVMPPKAILREWMAAAPDALHATKEQTEQIRQYVRSACKSIA